jgi:putative transposase
MMAFTTERLMELEVAALTGAAYSEKSPERRAQHNGYRSHLETRPDSVELRSPNWRPVAIFQAF